MSDFVRAAIERSFREERAGIVATLIRTTGDWDLAEECAQEAYARAQTRWSSDGVPDRPGAWLTTVARNRALDQLRRRTLEDTKLREVANEDAASVEGESHDIEDDRLRLIFTCCHPALALEVRVWLTLRVVAGLTTSEIARAFLVPEPTMAKRLVRAKQKIKHAGIPFRVPSVGALEARTNGVLAVIYLLFNEGYTASSGSDLMRPRLCEEAIRLGELLVTLMPDDAEATCLLVLMRLHHARRAARADPNGDLVSLDEQDRSRWDWSEIDAACSILEQTAFPDDVGMYRLQAAIAACHASARQASATDWTKVAQLYTLLVASQPSPVIALNHAIAIAMTEGYDAGLVRVDGLAAELEDYYLLHAAKADLLRRLGRRLEAAASYRRALELVGSDAERRFLERRLAEVVGQT